MSVSSLWRISASAALLGLGQNGLLVALPVLAYQTLVWTYGRGPTTVRNFSIFHLKRRFTVCTSLSASMCPHRCAMHRCAIDGSFQFYGVSNKHYVV